MKKHTYHITGQQTQVRQVKPFTIEATTLREAHEIANQMISCGGVEFTAWEASHAEVRTIPPQPANPAQAEEFSKTGVT